MSSFHSMNKIPYGNYRNIRNIKNSEIREDTPACYAIGDIEGDSAKLQYYTNFIKNHPKDNFVFIGDLFDDLSDQNSLKESNWSCIQMICHNYLDDKIKFKRDEDNSESTYDENIVSLPSGFHKINFDRKRFEDISNRVKFVAGNSECDCLSDILDHCEEKNGKYIFGRGKWRKTVTFDQLCILYRYLSACNGVIVLNNECESDAVAGFKHTVYFRHSIQKFKVNNNVSKQIEQRTNASSEDINNRSFIFIAGHSKIFTCTGPIEFPDDDVYYIIDTSSIDPTRDKRSRREYPHEIRGRGNSDHRMAAIRFDEKHGYTVDVHPFKFNFKRWRKRFNIAEIIQNIQQTISCKFKHLLGKKNAILVFVNQIQLLMS
ncbi:hypothetical protein M9Y10_036763 [Tritrichomonas musculus]|uniref:Calcineurin-like phosphoesterase domain-containing protein n=1 Tax=Tritrichomonas musculus TaxID=1915356 RepID=A0ABR2GTQ6_9EUKA